ncbi:LysR family transcriptional regulator, partial [Alcaligenes phenolicus]
RRADAPRFVHGASIAARTACHEYCEKSKRLLVEAL